MKKAVLYARVSSQRQQEDHTIESQVAELKQQIQADGNVLVKEYIDDGYSGTRIDRPALEQLREDLKIDLFDSIYFLCADRIARNVAHQNIVISDILRHEKSIIINHKDYEHNPENSFALTILGAVAELERAKIIERSTRGRRHKMRMGQVMSQGQRIFGYRYVRKTLTMPQKLILEPIEAKAVLKVFEMYATGKYGVYRINRWLEENNVLTKLGKRKWVAANIMSMLRNPTYAGTRYYNRVTRLKVGEDKIRPAKYGKMVARDKSDWIGVPVPAIVSKELFEQVQNLIAENRKLYRQPIQHQLLSGLIECGECGRHFSSSRRYVKKMLKTGIERIYNVVAYGCNSRMTKRMHAKELAEKCTNKTISTHLLENKVFELLKEFATDYHKLKECMNFFKNVSDKDFTKSARHIKQIEQDIIVVENKKITLIDQYASEKITREEYVNANRDQDTKLESLKQNRNHIVSNTSLLYKQSVVEANTKQFCEAISLQLKECDDFDSKRKLLLTYIEKVTYVRYKVTVHGSIPIKYQDEIGKLPFSIIGEIDRATLKTGARRKYEIDGRLKAYGSGGRTIIKALNSIISPLQK